MIKEETSESKLVKQIRMDIKGYAIYNITSFIGNIF